MSEAEVYEQSDQDVLKEAPDRLSAAKEWGSYIFSKAVKSSEEVVKKLTNRIDLTEIKSAVSEVTSTVKQVSLIREFQQAQADFTEAHQSKQSEPVDFNTSTQSDLPPWHPDVSGLSDPNAISALKENILALSQNPNNFLIPPPEEAQLKWITPIPQDLLHEAQILLKEDPNLGSIRYRLVPSKISEDVFWRNYFYRLSLIRQSAHLSAVMANHHHSNTANSNGGSTGSDNSVSDTDFVCIEQNPIWSRTKPNSEVKDNSEVSLNKDRKSNHPLATAKISSNEHSKTSSLLLSSSSKNGRHKKEEPRCLKSAPNSTSVNSKVNENISLSSKSLEEQLEEEITREVDELVLAKSENNSDNNNNNNEYETDDIDEELELEILAEMQCDTDDRVNIITDVSYNENFK
ncbi:unnamed protein product [Heterobilharzia americana]|nr:unnamed protein product [Heterobilharzia americana]